MSAEQRRERYAAAMAAIDCERWGIPVPDKGHEFWRVWYALADAAMAVADEELASLRGAWHEIVMGRLKHINRLKDENARLRAELERQKTLTDAYKEGAKLAAEKFHAEIRMLRNALDALEGEQDG